MKTATEIFNNLGIKAGDEIGVFEIVQIINIMGEQLLLIYHVKQANKEKDEIINKLLSDLRQVEEERDNLRIIIDMAQGIPKN